jgi:glyoxylase I family protein
VAPPELAGAGDTCQTRAVFSPLGLDHVVLRVRDQAASQRFYVDLLGCTLDHINEKISLIQLRFGDHLIDLLPATSAGAGPRSGLDHVCLSIRCDDLGKVAEGLRARGVTLEGEIVERRGAFGTGPSLYILDPDGYVIELKPR